VEDDGFAITSGFENAASDGGMTISSPSGVGAVSGWRVGCCGLDTSPPNRCHMRPKVEGAGGVDAGVDADMGCR